MPETFLRYWQREQQRLADEYELACRLNCSHRHLASRLQRIVDDELARWSRDLSD